MKSDPKILPREIIEGFISIIVAIDNFLESNFDLPNNTSWLKEDDSPVGTLDLMIESYAKDLVGEFLPGFEFIGEESPLPSGNSGNYVVIDPVDGTENFVSGLPFWGCGIALIRNNQLSASWVVFPELNFSFTSKEVSALNTIARRRFRPPQHKTRIAAYSSNTRWPDLAPSLSGEIRVLGCSLLNLTLASIGSVSFSSSPAGARVWDILPPLLFAIEAGKTVLVNGGEYFGQFLDPNLRYVVEIR